MIPFNQPSIVGSELEYIKNAVGLGKICGDGSYTKKSQEMLEQILGVKKALLVHSCTAALEMCAILLDIKEGDEIIMPSYTFVSTANAFVMRGGVPVFVDIREDTLNIDEKLIEDAITEKTKAIVCVHYAGVACEMDVILGIAKKYNLFVVEDAAQALGSYYKNKALGSFGDMACFSFHETKNVISGEGGALVVNNENFIERAEIIREKGTNRSQFFRGEIDKYTWVDVGSSYLPSDIIAAFLYAQLEKCDLINQNRMKAWEIYNNFFSKISEDMELRLPFIPQECNHNAHMYYVIHKNIQNRTSFIQYLKNNNIHSVFHYIPLHSSPAGKKFGRYIGNMEVTNKVSDTLVRMPMYYNIDIKEIIGILKCWKNGN